MNFDGVVNYFTKNNFDLKYLGLFLNDFSAESTWYRFYWFLIHVIFIGLLNILSLINFIFKSTTLEGAAAAGYIISTCVIGQLKIFLLINNRKSILRLMDLFEQEHFRPQNKEERNIVQTELKFFKKIKRALVFYCFTSIALSIITPIFNKKNKSLPIPAWYPTNISVSPIAEIVTFHQDVSAALVGTIFTLVEIMFGGILTFAGIQCNILSYRIKYLTNKNLSGQKMHRVLVSCVAHHKEIIKFVKITEEIFGGIYFWQIAATTLSLCNNLFLVSLTDIKTYEFFHLVVFMIAVVFLLFLPCWFASEVTRKGENINMAAYGCNWIEADNSFKKKLIFFIQRTQQPLKLYAANFFEISVHMFVTIIRTSLSYYAVLSNFNA